jgi:Raf kinase inhibitor-like YbhB/YbcL family protein
MTMTFQSVTHHGFMALAVLSLALAVSACDDGDDGSSGGGGSSSTSGTGGTPSGGAGGTGGGGGTLPFALTSSAFVEGATIPMTYECGPPLVADGPGDNISPPLAWTPGPPTTLSYAVVMRDLDAGNLVHWVVYDIPAAVMALPENIPTGYQPPTPAGSKQGQLQGVHYGYLGPCSANGVNTYQLTVHALATETLPGVDMSTGENDLAAAVEGASTASAALSGES